VNKRKENLIEFLKGSFEKRTFIKEFHEDSVLLSIKLKSTNIFIDRLIPVNEISSIIVKSKLNHFKGALNGLIYGIICGGLVGLASEERGSQPGSTPGPFGFDTYKRVPIAISYVAPITVAIGLTFGARKSYRFKINGNKTDYQKHQPEMQELLIKKEP